MLDFSTRSSVKLHPSFIELRNKSLHMTIEENWGEMADARMKGMWLE